MGGVARLRQGHAIVVYCERCKDLTQFPVRLPR
jgi:hypothetical protein